MLRDVVLHQDLCVRGQVHTEEVVPRELADCDTVKGLSGLATVEDSHKTVLEWGSSQPSSYMVAYMVAMEAACSFNEYRNATKLG